MDDLTVNNANVNNQPDGGQQIESQQQSVTSTEGKVWDERYPKWQRSMPKEYWGDERLGRFDSLEAVIKEVLYPKRKAPEQYDLKLGTDFGAKVSDAFKKADVSGEDANAINALYMSQMPHQYTEEDAKDVFGLADYEVVKAYKENAVNKICGSNTTLKDKITKSSYYNDPSFVEFAKIIGKELGNGNVVDFKNEQAPVHEDVWAKMVATPRTK